MAALTNSRPCIHIYNLYKFEVIDVSKQVKRGLFNHRKSENYTWDIVQPHILPDFELQINIT